MGERKEVDPSTVPDDFGGMFVTNLVGEEDDIRNLFQEFGTVKYIRLLPQKEDQTTRAAIVTLSSKAEAEAAMSGLRNTTMEGADRRVRLNWDGRSLERRLGGGGRNQGGFGSTGGGGGFGSSGGFGGFSSNANGGGFGNSNNGFSKSGVENKDGKLIYEGRELVPLKCNVDGTEVVTGFLFKENAASVPGTPATSVGATNGTSGFGFGGSSAPQQNGSAPPERRGFGLKFGAPKEEEKQPEPEFPPKSEEKKDTYFNKLRDMKSSEDKSEAGPSERPPLLPHDIIPKIEDYPLGPPLRRRQRIDLGNTALVTESPPSDAPRREHPQIEIPGEGPAWRGVQLRRKPRSGASMSGADNEAEAFKETELPADASKEIEVVFGGVAQDGTVGFNIVKDGSKCFSSSAAGKELSSQMKAHYASSSATGDKAPGKPVAVLSNDEWYRGYFVASGGSDWRPHVRLIDVGMEIVVPEANVRSLDKKFCEAAPAAIFATVEGLLPANMKEWGALLTNAIANLKDLQQTIIVTKSKPLEVKFSVGTIPAPVLVLGEKKKAAGENVGYGALLLEDNGIVFIVDHSRSDELLTIQGRVAEEGKLKPANLKVGAANIVQYEGQLYRGAISGDLNGGRYEIELSDYGNLYTCGKEDIFGMSEQLAKIESPSFSARLEGVPESGDAKVAERAHPLLEHVVLYQRTGEETVLVWDHEAKLLSGAEKAAQPKPSAIYYGRYGVGDGIKASVSFIENPETLFLSDTGNTSHDPALEQLGKDLNAMASQLEVVKAPAKDDLVAAQWSEDHLWYRAAIKEVRGDGKCDVLFVDWGNCEIIDLDHLRQLPKKMAETPRFLIPVKISGMKPKNGGSYDEKVTENADPLLKSQKGVFTVEKVLPDVFVGKFVLETGEDVVETLAKAGLVDKA